jgi:hypothetical protein
MPRRKKQPEPEPPAELAVVATPRQKARLKEPRHPPIRDLALFVYVTDPSLPRIEDLPRMEKFRGLSVSMLTKWCHADHWVEHRAEYQEQMFERAKAKVGAQMVKRYIELTDSLWKMFEDGVKRLSGVNDKVKMPEAKSFESLLRAVTYVGSTYAELARHVIDAATPAQVSESDGAASSTPEMTATLTPEEHQAAVATILKMRVAAMKAGVPDAEEGQKFQEETPAGKEPGK